MMNRDSHITFYQSMNLLYEIFPAVNWYWVLPNNSDCLSDGFNTIPFNEEANAVIYKLGDIEMFAVKFGQGCDVTAEEIAFIIDAERPDQNELDSELDQLLEELGHGQNHSCNRGNSILKVTPDADVNISLDNNEKPILLKAIHNIADRIRSLIN